MEWIKVEDRLPETKEDRHGNIGSDNVLAVCEGNLMIMAYCLLHDDDNNLAWFWCNCYGEIDGDPELDDDYEVTHWMPLPAPPQD